MLIEDKRTIKTVPFKDIAIGECFSTVDIPYIAMRIPPIEDTWNTIYLDSGEIEHFNPEEEVIPVKAKVVVE